MPQITRDCAKIQGWSAGGRNQPELVGHVLQSLIDEGLVVLRNRFELTVRGRQYLEDPMKWNIETQTAEEMEQNQFWKSIYEIFDRAYRRLRLREGTTSSKR